MAPGRTVARLRWHVDDRSADGPGYGDVVVEVVVCVLSHPGARGQSSMRVARKREVWYNGAGQGVMFHSALSHMSGAAEPGTIKVAVF